MPNEIEKALDDAFIDLFEKNYTWLLCIVIIHLVVFIIYMIIQLAKHHKTDSPSNNEIEELRKQIQSLKFRLDYIAKNHNHLKETFDDFKNKHQNTSLEELNIKLDNLESFFKNSK